MSNDNVRSIYADREGAVWIGTFGGGLNRLDPVSGQFTHFRSEPGKRDGLYWDDPSGKNPSPLGPLLAEAAA